MTNSASKIDEVGRLVESRIQKGETAKIGIEGDEFEGDVIGLSKESTVSDYQFKLELSGNNILVVFTDVIQRTQPEEVDHYKSEAYMIHNNERHMDYVGLVTNLELLN